MLGPEDETELTLKIPLAIKATLEKVMEVGAAFAAVNLPVATGAEDVMYSVTGLPPGMTAVENSEDDAFAVTIMAEDGLLPANLGTSIVVYRASATVNLVDVVDTDTFTLTLADQPDVIDVAPTVFAAGPSSLKVTWVPPASNNAKITGYRLQYRPNGQLPGLPSPQIIAGTAKTYTLRGLAPGRWDVQVRAENILGMAADWSPTGSGSTGAGPGKPTLTVTVDPTMPEARDGIPVTVTATVPPSADDAARVLKVTLTLKTTPGTLPENAAELPSTTGNPADLVWEASTGTAGTTSAARVLTFNFNSNLSSEAKAYLTTREDNDAEDEVFRITASAKADDGGVFSAATAVNKDVTIDDAQEQAYEFGASLCAGKQRRVQGRKRRQRCDDDAGSVASQNPSEELFRESGVGRGCFGLQPDQWWCEQWWSDRRQPAGRHPAEHHG